MLLTHIYLTTTVYFFRLNLVEPAWPKKVIKFCLLKKINIEELKKQIKQIVDYSDTVNDLISLVNYYNDELSIIFDKHAPQVEKDIRGYKTRTKDKKKAFKESGGRSNSKLTLMHLKLQMAGPT